MKILIIISLLLIPLSSYAVEISGPDVTISNGQIIVNASLTGLDREFEDNLKAGVEKELVFYVDLFRVWHIWPNEFVSGKKIEKIVKYDPLKSEYKASSYDGLYLIKRSFRDYNSMMQWFLFIRDIRLINRKELEPGTYLVKVTVESRLRKLPPVIGYMLFFIPEVEFKVEKSSQPFAIGGRR